MSYSIPTLQKVYQDRPKAAKKRRKHPKSMVTDVEEIVMPPPAPKNKDPLVASLQAGEEIQPPPSPKNDDPLVALVPSPPVAPPKVSDPLTSSGHFDFWSHLFLFHFLLMQAQEGVEAAPPKVSYPSTPFGHFDFWSHPFLFHFLLTPAQKGVDFLRKEWANYLTFPGWKNKNMLKARFPTKESMTDYLEAGGATVHRSTKKEILEGMVKEMLPPRGDVWYHDTHIRLNL